MIPLCDGCSAPPDSAVIIIYGALALPFLGWGIAAALVVYLLARRFSR